MQHLAAGRLGELGGRLGQQGDGSQNMARARVETSEERIIQYKVGLDSTIY